LLAAVHCLKSIKLRLDLTALYIAGECATFSNSLTEERNIANPIPNPQSIRSHPLLAHVRPDLKNPG
jgi:hypothetical protein